MKSLFDSNTHQEVLQRIEHLNDEKQPLWGKMTVAEMLHHSQGPLKVANGRMTIMETSNPFMRLVMRFYKSHMYNDIPWKQNLPTIKEFKVTHQGPFLEEKEKLIASLNEFNKKALNLHWPKHPFLGNFTTDQWGKMQYKHIDHHLRQFGV